MGVGAGSSHKSLIQEQQLKDAREKAHQAAQAAREAKDKVQQKASAGAEAVSQKAVEASKAAKEALAEKATQANDATKTKPADVQPKQKQSRRPTGKDLDPTPQPLPEPSGQPYTGPALPLGFEPPPGFYIPRPKKKESNESPTVDPLPLVAPSLSSFSLEEPSLGHLASTIDALAAFLKDNPQTATEAGGVKKVLSTAEADLKGLGERLKSIKDSEKAKLEQSLSEQSRKYADQVAQNEQDLIKRLKSQEEDWQKNFEQERDQMVSAYRTKLNSELNAQKELINERLKEELIAQGIEMQRRWMKDIKMRVEEERGGRLAKLEDLSENVKKLEEATVQNSTYLEESLQVNRLWSALQAAATSDGQGAALSDSIRALKELGKDDQVIQTAIQGVRSTSLADGIQPFSDLASWFSLKVAPRIKNAALMPEINAGCVAYWTSYALSPLLFSKQGWSEGNDVMSILGRAEYYLSRKDLDGATRQVNQLTVSLRTLLACVEK